jgi:hypothetical protein
MRPKGDIGSRLESRLGSVRTAHVRCSPAVGVILKISPASESHFEAVSGHLVVDARGDDMTAAIVEVTNHFASLVSGTVPQTSKPAPGRQCPSTPGRRDAFRSGDLDTRSCRCSRHNTYSVMALQVYLSPGVVESHFRTREHSRVGRPNNAFRVVALHRCEGYLRQDRH